MSSKTPLARRNILSRIRTLQAKIAMTSNPTLKAKRGVMDEDELNLLEASLQTHLSAVKVNMKEKTRLDREAKRAEKREDSRKKRLERQRIMRKTKRDEALAKKREGAVSEGDAPEYSTLDSASAAGSTSTSDEAPSPRDDTPEKDTSTA